MLRLLSAACSNKSGDDTHSGSSCTCRKSNKSGDEAKVLVQTHFDGCRARLASFPDLPQLQFLIALFLHTASDQKLELGKVWE